MKRGFPRPRKLLEKPTNWRISDDKFYQGKTWPHPYSANDNDLADVKPGRAWECVQFKRCQVCGEPVKGEKVWIYLLAGEVYASDSGPYHEKCVRLTKRMCPVVALNEDHYRFQEENWSAVRKYILRENGVQDA